MLEGVRLERGVWGLPTPHPRSKAKQTERDAETNTGIVPRVQGYGVSCPQPRASCKQASKQESGNRLETERCLEMLRGWDRN